MTRYHVNPQTGEAGACQASKRCPFGGDEAHHDSLTEARSAYEKSMGNGLGTNQTEPEELRWRYDIPSYHLASALKKIEKANKRAERAGIEERFGYTTETYEVRDTDENGLTTVTERVKLYLDRPSLQEQGWTFAGTMSWDPESGLVTRMVPGAELSETPKGERCDVCETTRHRSDTYIVQRGGEQLQVGSACLQRFMGIKPGGLWMLEFDLEDYPDAGDEEFVRGGERWEDQRRDSKELMGLALAVVEANGWTSRAAARDSYGSREATADIVSTILGTRPRSDEDARGREALLARAKELEDEAEEVLELARELDGESEYERNLKKLASAESVSMRNMPIFISAIAAHRRETARVAEELAKAKLPESSWVGTVGEKLSPRTVTVESVRVTQSAYGTSQLVSMRDEDGNLYKTFYGGSAEVKKGDSYSLASATVKKHDEWQGVKETMIGRAKFESVRPAQLPPSSLPASSPYAQAWTVEENAAANNAELRRIKKELKKKATKQGGWDTTWDRPNDPELQKERDEAERETNQAFSARYRELMGEEPVSPVVTPNPGPPRQQ